MAIPKKILRAAARRSTVTPMPSTFEPASQVTLDNFVSVSSVVFATLGGIIGFILSVIAPIYKHFAFEHTLNFIDLIVGAVFDTVGFFVVGAFCGVIAGCFLYGIYRIFARNSN